MPSTPATRNVYLRSLVNAAARQQGEGRELFASELSMRPGAAVQTLRGLHTANEPTCVQFVFELCQFLNAGPTEAQMQAFLSSGLLALLADIVSEPQSFVLDRALHVSTQLCISGTLLLTNELHVGSGSKGGLCSVNP